MGAKADDSDTAPSIIVLANDQDPHRHSLIVDTGYRRPDFEAELNSAGITLFRPGHRGEKPTHGRWYLGALRQVSESINWTFEGRLDLQYHGRSTKPGVCARVLQRALALAVTIWHDETATGPDHLDHSSPTGTYPPRTNRLGSKTTRLLSVELVGLGGFKFIQVGSQHSELAFQPPSPSEARQA